MDAAKVLSEEVAKLVLKREVWAIIFALGLGFVAVFDVDPGWK